MKRKGPAPVAATDLPVELQRFNWTDWTSESDPPPWDPEKLLPCPGYTDSNGTLRYHEWNGERTHGCTCKVSPLMWSADQRYSEMHARYHDALEGWAFRRGLSVDEVYFQLEGGWPDIEELITG